ncbi:MAG: DUF167 domain-containing protein [Nanoarchaeota archaeon]|nr:DUF167 domain-containing protein [Nanoarchaeota archaeon]
MIIKVKVKPGAKENKIEKISNDEYNVSLKERAENGKANVALLKILSKHFDVPFQDIIIKNKSSRYKLIAINR